MIPSPFAVQMISKNRCHGLISLKQLSSSWRGSRFAAERMTFVSSARVID